MHKTYLIVRLFILFFLLSASLNVLIFEETQASIDIIWVDDSYRYPSLSDGSSSKPFTTIQKAVDAASNGDLIIVREGFYSDMITVDKQITIRSEETEKAVITGAPTYEYLIGIKSKEVSIEGLKFLDTYSTHLRKAVIYIDSFSNDTTILNNKIEQCTYSYAISLNNVDNVVLKGNILNNSSGGISLSNSNFNYIISNSISNHSNKGGLNFFSSNHNIVEFNSFFNESKAIILKDSKYNQIIGNNIKKSSSTGLYVKNSLENIIDSNIFLNNYVGVQIEGEDKNFVYNNSFNDRIGIVLSGSNSVVYNNIFSNCRLYAISGDFYSADNLIYNNYFTGEGTIFYAREHGNNIWFNEGKKIGNYWEDFNGPDRNNPYVKQDLDLEIFEYKKAGVIDKYPLGKFSQPPNIGEETPKNFASNVSLKPKLSIVVTHPDEKQITVSFYKTIDNITSLVRSVRRVRNNTNVSINLFSPTKYFAEGYNYICEWFVILEDEYYLVQSENFIFTTSEIPIKNIPPVINPGGPYTGLLDEKILFNASKSYDPDGEIVFYRWIFGDGTIIANNKTVRKSFKNPGTYSCSLLIIDNNGSSKTTSFDVTIYSKPDEDSLFSKNLSCFIYTKNNETNFETNEKISLYSNIIGGFPPYKYSWNITKDTNLFFDTKNISLNISKTGIYTINFTIIDNFNNTAYDTFFIEVVSTEPVIDDTDVVIEEKIPGYKILSLFISIIVIFIIKKKKFFREADGGI